MLCVSDYVPDMGADGVAHGGVAGSCTTGGGGEPACTAGSGGDGCLCEKSAPPPTCMQVYYNRVSSLPKGLVVADFLIHMPLRAKEQNSKHGNMH